MSNLKNLSRPVFKLCPHADPNWELSHVSCGDQAKHYFNPTLVSPPFNSVHLQSQVKIIDLPTEQKKDLSLYQRGAGVKGIHVLIGRSRSKVTPTVYTDKLRAKKTHPPYSQSGHLIYSEQFRTSHSIYNCEQHMCMQHDKHPYCYLYHDIIERNFYCGPARYRL